jgi:hypothetical protein
LWSILESTASAPLSTGPTSASPSSGSAGNPSGRGTRLEGNNMDQKLVGLIKRMQDSRLRELRDERSRAAQVGSSTNNGGGTSSAAGATTGKRG